MLCAIFGCLSINLLTKAACIVIKVSSVIVTQRYMKGYAHRLIIDIMFFVVE